MARVTELRVNGAARAMDVDGERSLLGVLRDVLDLTGTKYGCGVAQCGACTVHVDGETMRSCAAPVGAMSGRKITTIEGISSRAAKAVQKAWVELDVVQCGYCQSGQIMSAVALLKEPCGRDDADVKEFMSGNICRCGAYPNIVAAIQQVRGNR